MIGSLSGAPLPTTPGQAALCSRGKLLRSTLISPDGAAGLAAGSLPISIRPYQDDTRISNWRNLLMSGAPIAGRGLPS
jgi:hypothetical protein